MYRPGHYGVALLAWAPIGFALATDGHAQLALLGGAVVVGLTPLPDFDHRLPLVEHRGITHTLAFAILVAAATAGVGWVLASELAFVRTAYGSPAFLGTVGAVAGGVSVLAHLLGDVVTPAGIEPFSPVWGHNVSLGIVGADSTVANYGLLSLGVLATVGAAYLSVLAVA